MAVIKQFWNLWIRAIVLAGIFSMAAFHSMAQTKEIYHATFSDKSNFSSGLRFIGKKMPAKILVLSKTHKWYDDYFWVDGLSGKTPEELKDTLEDILRDEHHPYNTMYYFKDTLLHRLFPDSEKLILKMRSDTLKPGFLKMKAKTYQTITSATIRPGFYIETSEPIFSSDGKCSFIKFYYLYKEGMVVKNDLDYFQQDSFGSVAIVFAKNSDGKWYKIWRRIIFF